MCSYVAMYLKKYYSLFSILMAMSIKKYRFYILLVSICFFMDPSVSRGQALKIQHDLVVAKDGSGDYRYIQDAIDAIRVYLPKPITVRMKTRRVALGKPSRCT